MTAGLLNLAKGQGTTDPLLSKFLIARNINLAAGGAVIAPWQVDDLPEIWIDAASALTVDLPDMQKGQAQVEERLQRWREEHKKRNA